MKDPDAIAQLFSEFGPVSVRRMFGGVGIFADGLMIGLGYRDEVYLKTDDATAQRFAAAGSSPFVYEAKGRELQLAYWRLPTRLYDDPAELAEWAKEALAVARRANDRKVTRGARPPAGTSKAAKPTKSTKPTRPIGSSKPTKSAKPTKPAKKAAKSTGRKKAANADRSGKAPARRPAKGKHARA
jgi:DNA transformation protein